MLEARRGRFNSHCSFTSINKITRPGEGGAHGRLGGFGWLAYIRPHPQLVGGAWEPNANPQRRGRAAGEGGKCPGADSQRGLFVQQIKIRNPGHLNGAFWHHTHSSWSFLAYAAVPVAPPRATMHSDGASRLKGCFKRSEDYWLEWLYPGCSGDGGSRLWVLDGDTPAYALFRMGKGPVFGGVSSTSHPQPRIHRPNSSAEFPRPRPPTSSIRPPSARL